LGIMREGMMQILDASAFTPCLNQVFHVSVGETRVDMTLVGLSKLPPHPYPGMRREPFVLTFRSAMRTIFPQQTYLMDNATLGTLPILIVPSGMDREGTLYHAVFN
jgi:hypothetical protein